MELEGKKILDATCGSRMMWFDKEHPETIYTDKRKGTFGHPSGNKGKTIWMTFMKTSIEPLSPNE